MKRRLPNLLYALSLLLCVGLSVPWVRSYGNTPAFEWWSPGPPGFEFRVRGVYARRGTAGFYVGDYPAGLSGGTYQLVYHRSRSERQWPPTDGTLGFAAVGSDTFGGGTGVRWHEWRVPCWSLLLVAGSPALWRARRVGSDVRRRRRGLCPACGYDLRATPDRCPECGSVATNDA